ncbi:cell adhesion molecule 3-like [Ptychodera flava]|uniref:cell adhesion molecule 3-like n=1 Tax=Ptychodera flava TaxID=63121 RepID=UPI00396A1B4B
MIKTLLFVTFLSLFHVSLGQVTVTTDPLVNGIREKTVTLKCSFAGPANAGSGVVITWSHTPERGGPTEVIYSKSDGSSGVARGRFVGRVNVAGTRADLTISRLEILDAGTFICDVNFYVAKQIGSGSTTLKVNQVAEIVDILNHYTGDYAYTPLKRMSSFECRASRAKPAAKLIWTKNNRPLQSSGAERIEENMDGTFNTISQISFTPVREDHHRMLRCQSDQSPYLQGQYKQDHITLSLSGAAIRSISMVFLFVSIVIGMVLTKM